ncbi:hypothetical protein JCM11641_005714 [Rhodosporidiobolus odoratus]
MRAVAVLSALALPLLAASQTTTSFPSSTGTDTVFTATSTGSDSTTTLTNTLTRTLTGTVIATSDSPSTTSTSSIPAPSANVTNGVDQDVRLWLVEEELRMCDRVTFAFTGPALAKTCGVFVTNTSTYLQQIPLGGNFASLTAGTFSWLVDVPAGLSLEVQLFVSINGGVSQYTLHNLMVQEGDNNTCLATGPGQNTQSIVSYASALNSSYTYEPPKAPSPSKKGSNAGAIAGGVVGALVGLAAIILIAYLIYRRRKRSIQPPPPDGEKPYDWGGSQVAYPAPGQPSYAQMIAQQYNGGVVPYQSARPTSAGLAAEPMPAPGSPGPNSPHAGLSHSNSEFGTTAHRGTEGLENPNTFVSRSTGSPLGTRG